MKNFCNIIIFFFCITLTFAQAEFKFERITTDEGLPANYVLSVIQDSNGFIWFGMRGACCRYNGFSFETFPVKTDLQDESLTTWVNCFAIDNLSRLWIGENGQFGLLKFDADNEVFVNVSHHVKTQLSLNKISASSMLCDNDGLFWVGNQDAGIIVLNPETNEMKCFRHEPDNQNSIPPGICNTLFEDFDGTIWIGTLQGLCKYSKRNKFFIHYKSLPGYSGDKITPSVLAITGDSDKNLWVATIQGGLLKYDREKDSFVKWFKNNDLSKSTIYSIREDKMKRFWIGTNNGLYITDSKKKDVTVYKHSGSDPESINSNIIKSVFIDNTGTVWIGTTEGVAIARESKFKTFKVTEKRNSISQNKVQFILENQYGNIWISTPIGIDIYDKKSQQFSFLSGISRNNAAGLSNAPITFCEEKNKGMWIGTYKGGLSLFDYSTHRFQDFSSVFNTDTLNNQSVFSIIIDNHGLMWLATWNGILTFNPKTNEFRSFVHEKGDKTTIPSNNVLKIVQDSQYRVWAGTIKGVSVLEDYQSKKFRRVVDQDILQSNKEIMANSFQETNNGEYMWIATDIGLLRYGSKTNNLVLFNKKNGFPSDKVRSVVEDNQRRLWIGTTKGLIMAIPDSSVHAGKLKLRIFNKSDGLHGNEFLPGSCCKLNDGSLIFGGSRGMSMFHPDSIIKNSIAPTVTFTNLIIEDKAIGIGEERNGQVILKKSINKTGQLVLNYQNNNFTIEFIALHFTKPVNNKYSYQLRGFDTKWHYTDAANRQAHYMHLKSGEYTFFVKAANSDGIWCEKPAALTITILPPWWRTWWFSIISVVFLIASFLIIVKLRTQNLLKQKQKLEHTVEQRTHELKEMNLELQEGKEELVQQARQLDSINSELKKSNLELKIKTDDIEKMAKQLHEEDLKQLRFFANISHEFRTPLTLIINPLEKLLDNSLHFDRAKINLYHQLMHRNSKRLLRLINQIIDFRKIDLGRKTLHVTHNNIESFIVDVKQAFSTMAEAKQIQLRVKSEELRVKNEEISNTEQLITHHSSLITQFWFDPDIMEKILYNIISNAIKYTPEGGEVLIAIGVDVTVETLHVADPGNVGATSPPNNQLAIKISDTGIGIKPENLDRIFDRFYRVKTRLTASQPEGTGIGLAYTKELVDLHNGTISVDSQYGKGTTFTLHFPMNLKHEPSPGDIKDHVQLEYIQTMIDISIPISMSEVPISDEIIGNNRISLLLVEDNEELRTFISEELKEAFDVNVAGNGEQALTIAAEILPDIIISDIMMPVMDGIELCEKIKSNENTSHIPVILLTARTGNENIIAGIETGADDYITKPFNFQILLAKIKNIIKIRKQLQEKFSNAPLEMSHQVSTSNPIDEIFIKKARDIVEKNLENLDFNNDMFIRELGMSRALVYKKIKVLTNLSVSEFIRNIRLKIAAQMLLEGTKNVSEVAYSTGFKYRQTFTRYFTEHFHSSPSEYIQKHSKTQ